jgi:hypothetical protein
VPYSLFVLDVVSTVIAIFSAPLMTIAGSKSVNEAVALGRGMHGRTLFPLKILSLSKFDGRSLPHS